MKDNNEIMWIKKSTKDKLYDIKGRKTFDKVISDLLESSNCLKKKEKSFFGKLWKNLIKKGMVS